MNRTWDQCSESRRSNCGIAAPRYEAGPNRPSPPRRWQASKPGVRAQRHPVPDDDPFLLAERSTSEQTSAALEAWPKFQNEAQERIFHALYR